MISLPTDVIEWLRAVFRECNRRITEKLSDNPNIPEESLDLTWIEHLSRFSSPITLPSSWTIRIETHYLGGMRHFYGWEIADIGLLLFIRTGAEIHRSKVALFQSKRLYPRGLTVTEEGRVDYQVGFARLADPEDLKRSIAVEAEFEFTPKSRYNALIPGSDQVNAIDDYERQSGLRTYYQLYNPWRVPFVRRIPRPAETESPDLTLGVRILPTGAVHSILEGRGKADRPQLADFANSEGEEDIFGWALEEFVVDEFLACREGSTFDSIADSHIRNLFYRRTGPIAAAVAITLEPPPARAG